MRPFRLVLAASVAALAAAGGTATAAPPVGCYGLPEYPLALVCITSFTPENVVPGVDPDGGSVPVRVPAYCAGTCHPATTVYVPVPAQTPGSGQIATVTYNGQTYVIGTSGGIPPLPPIPPIPPIPGVPPLLEGGGCPGYGVVSSVDTGPYVCLHRDGPLGTGATVYVGTCAVYPCVIEEVPLPDVVGIVNAIRDGIQP